MKKSNLLNYISKYSLGGNVESVTWNVTSQKATCKFITEEKTLLGVVECNNFDVSDGEYHVYDTSKLKSLLSVLGDDIDVKSNKIDKKLISLAISDNSTNLTYVLADETAISKAPNLKELPEFDIVLKLDKEFISKFIKAKNALNECDVFTLIQGKKKLEFVIGYSGSINSNKITLDVTAEKGKDTISKPISFNAKYFKEVLTSNNIGECTLNVSTKGLAKATFEDSEFKTEYYFVEVQID
jgi:hypothetical protein